MRTTFKELLKPTEAEEKTIWDNGIIVFDTNILMNLYRFTTDTRDDLLAQMEAYKDQLWLPYQVGWEYFNNRENVISSLTKVYKELSSKLNEDKSKLLKYYDDNYSRHPILKREELAKVFDKSIEMITKKLDDWKANTPDYSTTDPIKDKLFELYEGKVGTDLTEEEIKAIYQEGEERYADKIPPGFRDYANKKDKGKRHLYGDLIIWKQIIKYAKETQKDIIFVTQDIKEDWWIKKEGKAEGPLYFLLKEFRASTGQSLLMYKQEGFMKAASKKKTKAKTVKEVKAMTAEESRNRAQSLIEQIGSLQGLTMPSLANLQIPAYPSVSLDYGIPQSILDTIEQRRKITSAAQVLAGFTGISEWLRQNPAYQTQESIRQLISGIDPLKRK